MSPSSRPSSIAGLLIVLIVTTVSLLLAAVGALLYRSYSEAELREFEQAMDMDTATLREAPTLAIHSRSAEMVISRPMMMSAITVLVRDSSTSMQPFLQRGLRVARVPFGIQRHQSRFQQARHHRAGGVVTGFEKDRADQRFQRIREQCRPLAAAGFLFACAQPQRIAERDAGGDVRQRVFLDQRGTQPRQQTFRCVRKPPEQQIGGHAVEHRVAQQLESFVMSG